MTNLPVTGIFNITCEYKRKGKTWIAGYHTGIDITCYSNDLIYSTCDGIVSRVDTDKSYGKFVTIKEETTGNYHWFCHLSEQKVSVGERVSRVSVIGIMGATGNASGKHLHFEIRDNSNLYGNDLNPCDWLGIENKVQNGLNSENYQNNPISINAGDIKKFAVRTNVREKPNLEGIPHLFLANTAVEILETGVSNEDGYVWDKVRIVYAEEKDIKKGYVARTCTRYEK